MTELLSRRINDLEESQTIGMAKKARELAAQGIDIVNLTLGEPDFQTPQHIKDAAKKAIDEGFTFYTPVSGIPDLRKAIAEKFNRENHLNVKPENIVVSTGAKQAIANAILCLVDPRDEVVILGPYWVSYMEIVKLAEAIPVVVNGSLEQNFKPSLAQIEAAISSRTKVIIFSSPSNPTGAVFSKAELEGIARLVEKNPRIFVIADEIYEYINFTGKHESIGAFAAIADRVITINGVSKGFAMTGWRLGYMAAPKFIAEACDKMQGQFTSGANSITQKAAITALTSDLAPTFEMTKKFKERRDFMLKLMREIPGLKVSEPEGAFYLFPDVSYYFGKQFEGKVMQTSEDICMYLLLSGHVSTVPGEAFGAPNCLRLSFAAADDKLKEGVRRIHAALSKLS